MRYKAHLFGGACAGALALYGLNTCGYALSSLDLVIGFCACLAGSIFPDIDTRSVAQKNFFRVLFFSCVGALLYYQNFGLLMVAGFVGIIPLIAKHRGIFHRWWFLSILTLACSVLALVGAPAHTRQICICAGFFFVGCLTHLLLDM